MRRQSLCSTYLSVNPLSLSVYKLMLSNNHLRSAADTYPVAVVTHISLCLYFSPLAGGLTAHTHAQPATADNWPCKVI